MPMVIGDEDKGYQVAEGFSPIQDGLDKCFSQEAKVICEE